jgi:hypothetical protein
LSSPCVDGIDGRRLDPLRFHRRRLALPLLFLGLHRVLRAPRHLRALGVPIHDLRLLDVEQIKPGAGGLARDDESKIGRQVFRGSPGDSDRIRLFNVHFELDRLFRLL